MALWFVFAVSVVGGASGQQLSCGFSQNFSIPTGQYCGTGYSKGVAELQARAAILIAAGYSHPGCKKAEECPEGLGCTIWTYLHGLTDGEPVDIGNGMWEVCYGAREQVSYIEAHCVDCFD